MKKKIKKKYFKYLYKKLKINKIIKYQLKMMNKRQLDNLSPELEDHLKYAIIIDAGSSGTRIQIYSWIDTNFLKEKIKNTEKNEYLKYITDDGLPVIGQGSSSDNFDYQLKIEGGKNNIYC